MKFTKSILAGPNQPMTHVYTFVVDDEEMNKAIKHMTFFEKMVAWTLLQQADASSAILALGIFVKRLQRCDAVEEMARQKLLAEANKIIGQCKGKED